MGHFVAYGLFHQLRRGQEVVVEVLFDDGQGRWRRGRRSRRGSVRRHSGIRGVDGRRSVRRCGVVLWTSARYAGVDGDGEVLVVGRGGGEGSGRAGGGRRDSESGGGKVRQPCGGRRRWLARRWRLRLLASDRNEPMTRANARMLICNILLRVRWPRNVEYESQIDRWRGYLSSRFQLRGVEAVPADTLPSRRRTGTSSP